MIDWQRVQELRSEVGAEDFEEVVDLFLEEVDETIDRLRSAPDLSSLEVDLHFLKGSALNLGFTIFSQLCQKGEQQAAAGAAANVDIADLLNAFDTSRAEFIQKCAEFPDAA